MCLVALDEVVQHCRSEPYSRTFALRATLATLYALSDGDRRPFDTFWRACGLPNGEPYQAYAGRVQRNNELHGAYQAICRGVGCPNTITLGSDVSAARHDPGLHMRAYEERTRSDTPETKLRQLYAEALRRSGESH